MRIPFSIFLMPIFWFSLIYIDFETLNWGSAFLAFVIYHLLVYPASNGYNSYFDKDEGSIGGLEKPPQPNRQLFQLTVLFDSVAVLAGLLIDWRFSVMTLIYILVSKAYSWTGIRLKKYPITSLVVVTFFQGTFTYFAFQLAISGNVDFSASNLLLSIVAMLFLMGSYPITQVYQHDEDSERGDKTLSLMLGIRGTFLFSIGAFLVATGMTFIAFWNMGFEVGIFIYLVCTAPIGKYFTQWLRAVWKDKSQASFAKTMKMNKTSSLFMSLTFVLIKIYLFIII